MKLNFFLTGLLEYANGERKYMQFSELNGKNLYLQFISSHSDFNKHTLGGKVRVEA